MITTYALVRMICEILGWSLPISILLHFTQLMVSTVLRAAFTGELVFKE